MSHMEYKPSPEETDGVLNTLGHLQAELATRVLQALDDARIPSWRYMDWLDEYNIFENDSLTRLSELAREYRDASPPEPVDDDEAKKIARLARELIGEKP